MFTCSRANGDLGNPVPVCTSRFLTSAEIPNHSAFTDLVWSKRKIERGTRPCSSTY